MFTFLLLFEILPFVFKTISDFCGSVILKNWPFMCPIPIVLDMAGCRMCRFLKEYVLIISQKLHGGDRKHQF